MWCGCKNIIQILLICVALSGTTLAINCYVCDASDTKTPFQCGEWFERFDDPDIQPQNCSNVHEAKYCIKHIGRYEGGIGAKRFCSSKDLGNYCDYVKNKGDRMDYRSCIFTCSTDGCNGAGSLRPWITTNIVGPLLLVLISVVSIRLLDSGSLIRNK